MQYYSPFNGCPNGETNFPYVPISVPPVCPHPQIVGEGDVTSVTLPDGTLQLYFVPAARTYSGGYLPWGAVPAWFIRTIPNLFAAPRPFATNHRDNAQSSNTFVFPNNAEENEEKLSHNHKYQLQFHNDKNTSTTDINYFTQPLQHVQPCRCHSKQSGETQADHSTTYYEACRCHSKQHVETQADHSATYHQACCKACSCKTCGRRDLKKSGSAMSVESNTEEEKTHSKIKFDTDTSDDKCHKCKDKCNSTKRRCKN